MSPRVDLGGRDCRSRKGSEQSQYLAFEFLREEEQIWLNVRSTTTRFRTDLRRIRFTRSKQQQIHPREPSQNSYHRIFLFLLVASSVPSTTSDSVVRGNQSEFEFAPIGRWRQSILPLSSGLLVQSRSTTFLLHQITFRSEIVFDVEKGGLKGRRKVKSKGFEVYERIDPRGIDAETSEEGDDIV